MNLEKIVNNALLFLCMIYFLLLRRSCIAVSSPATITSTHILKDGKGNRFLRDGEMLLSEDGNFRLGFFSPGNSTKRYVGIWFARTTIQTVVWVANRETPIGDFSGTFKLGNDGNLVVLDGKEQILWSSNTSVASNITEAELLGSGNLILRKRDSVNVEDIYWQSFEHPTDTFLVGMKFGLNFRTGENQLLTAWKSANDPAPGNFSLGFDPKKIAQIVIWNCSERYWRSGQWNGQLLTGVPEMTSFHLYGFNIITDDDQGRLYCTYSNSNKSIASGFVLASTGKLERYYWNSMALGWDIAWAQPNSECQLYGKCGPFASCNRDASPICSCLPGFRPSFLGNGTTGNWSDGCLRNIQLECKDGNSSSNGFLKLSGMKLPDFSNLVPLIESVWDCQKICENSCSCIAYAYDSGLGCLTWDNDLVDIQKFTDGGQDLYLRLSKSTLRALAGNRRRKLAVVFILLITVAVLVLVVYGFLTYKKIRKAKALEKDESSQEFHFSDLGSQRNSNRHFLDADELETTAHKGKGPDLPKFSLDTVRVATDYFSVANKLGEGGFGPVYKGKLSSGQEIAVKRLSTGSGQGLLEFENEVILIAKLQHRNLVRLLGCCVKGHEKMLIYEYMPNKSLDFFLFGQTKQPTLLSCMEAEIKQATLDWSKRFSIIEGIARGLLYLHRDSRLRIIHRDLKASNILLDREMNPKISDFGMARIFGGDQNQANTMRVVGTYGYMAPEYAMEGLFSVKSDVFSFGVLLLEIVSGKRNASFNHSGQPLNLLGYAWDLWVKDEMLELLDPSLQNTYSRAQVLRCIQVGLLCVQDWVNDRPTMDSVVFLLGNETAILPTPKKPALAIGRTSTDSGLLGHSSDAYSVNVLTISSTFGR